MRDAGTPHHPKAPDDRLQRPRARQPVRPSGASIRRMGNDWLTEGIEFHAKLYTENPAYRRAYDLGQRRQVRAERRTLILHWLSLGRLHDWRVDVDGDNLYCKWCPARKPYPTGTD